MRLWIVFALGLCLVPSSLSAQEMPDWAAPQSRSDRQAGPSPTDDFSCGDANPNCVDVDPVPLGEGLALLALLGTGYAVRRLRCPEATE